MQATTLSRVLDISLWTLLTSGFLLVVLGPGLGIRMGADADRRGDYHSALAKMAADKAKDEHTYIVVKQVTTKHLWFVTYHLGAALTGGSRNVDFNELNVPDIEVDKAFYLRHPVKSLLTIDFYNDNPIVCSDSDGVFRTSFNLDAAYECDKATFITVTAILVLFVATSASLLLWAATLLVEIKARKEDSDSLEPTRENRSADQIMKLKAWVSYVLGFIVALFLTFVVYVKVHDAEEAAKERAKAAKLVQSAKPVRVNVNPIFISGSDSLLTPTVPKMPGRNPHGFILLRLALELRGWYVFWHPAIGAECWKPGRRHAYMWIRPNRYYVVLNGKHVPIKLAPVERYGTLWGDSSIGDVVDHALLSASKH